MTPDTKSELLTHAEALNQKATSVIA